MLKLITVSNTTTPATNAPATTDRRRAAKSTRSIHVAAKKRSQWKRFDIYDAAVLALTVATVLGCLASIGNMGF